MSNMELILFLGWWNCDKRKHPKRWLEILIHDINKVFSGFINICTEVQRMFLVFQIVGKMPRLQVRKKWYFLLKQSDSSWAYYSIRIINLFPTFSDIILSNLTSKYSFCLYGKVFGLYRLISCNIFPGFKRLLHFNFVNCQLSLSVIWLERKRSFKDKAGKQGNKGNGVWFLEISLYDLFALRCCWFFIF